MDDDAVTYSYNEHGSAEDVINEMLGKVITFIVTDGFVTSIKMPSDRASDSDITLALKAKDMAKSSSYDDENNYFRINTKRYDITDETRVFFIGSISDDFTYGEKVDNVENCTAGTGAILNTISGVSAAVYMNASTDGYVDALVLYNTDAGFSLLSGVAYITNIGTTINNNKEVLSVQYYQNGKLKTSLTNKKTVGDLSENTVLGSVFMFGFMDDTITSAKTYLTFDGTVRDNVATNAGIPKVKKLGTGVNSDEEVCFGAVLNRQSGKLIIATMDEKTLPNLACIEAFKIGEYNTNFYIYIPPIAGSPMFGIGTGSYITVDRVLTNVGGYEESLYDIIVDGETIGAPAWGMLDYVFMRTYNNKTDVVVYKAYDFDFDFEKK